MAPSIECDICHKVYNDSERKPKFLTCFHTFCLLCLEDLMKNNCITTKTTLSCPTCSEETIIQANETLDLGLKTNFYITQEAIGKSNVEKSEFNQDKMKEEQYYWCSNCKSIVNQEASCLKNHHDTCDMESEDIKEMAEMSLKMVFVTCKSQLNGAIGKYNKVESDLKASQIAIQAMEQQVNSLRKQNVSQTKKLQKQLSEVANHLSKESNQKLSVKEMFKLFETYNKIMCDSKDNSKKIGDQLADFELLRNAIISTKITTETGEELSTPLLNSASLNFPSKGGANELETNILTSLSFLILSCIKNGHLTKPVPLKKPQEEPKSTVEKPSERREGKTTQNKVKGLVRLSKTEGVLNRKEKKSTKWKELSRSAVQEKSLKSQFSSVPKTSHPSHFDHDLKDGPQYDTRRLHTSKVHPPPIASKRGQMATAASSTSFQMANHVKPFTPSPPPLMQFRNKKAFFVLAVNGKNYGTVVFDLRPDLAPVMCQHFFQNCQTQERVSYQGTVIYQTKPKMCIMGGRLPGSEPLYMADQSPLKKVRGSIFLRLKRDYAKTQCSVVSSEFGIHLGESESYKTTTVFGFVCDGLAVCDAISHMDCSRDHIAISSAGLVG